MAEALKGLLELQGQFLLDELGLFAGKSLLETQEEAAKSFHCGRVGYSVH
jgi:hypothetical protein